MARRKRTDSAAGQAEIFDGALSGPPNPPQGVTISKEVEPYWLIVVSSKAKRAWCDSDLVVAADIARTMWRLEKISMVLSSYSGKVTSTKSTHKHLLDKDYINLEKMADTLSKRVRFLSSHLQIHPQATQGSPAKQAKQNDEHRKAVAAAKAMKEDSPDMDLIARPQSKH